MQEGIEVVVFGFTEELVVVDEATDFGEVSVSASCQDGKSAWSKEGGFANSDDPNVCRHMIIVVLMVSVLFVVFVVDPCVPRDGQLGQVGPVERYVRDCRSRVRIMLVLLFLLFLW